MTAAEYIGLVNLTGGVMALHLFIPYAKWVYRDWRSLARISAGLLVFAFLFALIFRGYESLYYGMARFAAVNGVDLWNDDPWGHIIAFARTASAAVLLIAFAAKVRADGKSWRKTLQLTGLFACEGAAIAVALYLLLIA